MNFIRESPSETDGKDSNMNSVRESPSETEEMLFIVHPTRSPSGTVVAYDLPEDVTGMDLYGCVDKRTIRVHVEPIQQLCKEDIPQNRNILIEDVEIREIYSSKSSDITIGNPIEDSESSLAVTDIPTDELEDIHLDVPFTRVSDKESQGDVFKLDSTDRVSDPDTTQINQNQEDLVAIVEEQRYADYIESCKTTIHLCSVIIETCANKIGNPGQDFQTQNVSNMDNPKHSKPVPERATDVSVSDNKVLGTHEQRQYEDVEIPKEVPKENQLAESSSLEVTDIIDDVIGNRHLPIPFKIIPYGHWRPNCVPKLDLTGLASESDIDVAKISGYDISWLFPEPDPGNDASVMSHNRTSQHHEIYSSRISHMKTDSPIKERKSSLTMTDISKDEENHLDIPFKLASSSDRYRPDDVSKLDLRGIVSDSDINIARVDENTSPELVTNVEEQRYTDYIESCRTTTQLCSVIIEMCASKIGNPAQEGVSHENELAESNSLEVTDIIDDVIGNRHLPIPFKIIPYGHWRPKCVPKLDLTGLASESDIDVAKISGYDISWLFPEPDPGNDASVMSHKQPSQNHERSQFRSLDTSAVNPTGEHELPLAMKNFSKDKSRHLDIPDYIGYCKKTIHLCSVIIEKCSDQIGLSGQDLKNSSVKTKSASKERNRCVTSPNKENTKRAARVHFRDGDSVISDHDLYKEDDVPCIDLSLEVSSIRPVKEGHTVKEFLSSDEESPRDTTLDCAPELPYAGRIREDLRNDLPGKSQLIEPVDDYVGYLNLNMSANTTSDQGHQTRKNPYTKAICFQDRTVGHIFKDTGDVNVKSRY